MLVYFWNKLLDLVIKLFRRGLKLTFNCLGVKLQQTDISAGGQVCLKMLLVILEQLHNIGEVFNCIFKSLISKNVNVEFLVSPVDLKYGLEAS